MRILIDLCNSPHVLFFTPMVNILRQQGHTVFITARDNAQTIPLIEKNGWKYKQIGKHRGKNKLAKLFGFFHRIFCIVRIILKEKLEVSISSSYDCTVASWITRRRNIFFTDNEKANAALLKLCFHMATKIAIPKWIPLYCLVELGASSRKLIRYPGFKEEVYLFQFQPNPKVLEYLKLDKNQKIIVMRPEPNLAIYYHGPDDVLVNPLKELVDKNVQIVLLPRTEMQKTYYTEQFHDRIIIPKDVIDGPSLIYYADLVIGAGGTMNREAAILGTPVISTYQGTLLEVDKWLIAKGYLKHCLAPTAEEIENAMRSKKLYKINEDCLRTIMSEISAFL